MNIRNILFFVIFYLMNTLQSQATIVKVIEIEDEHVKSPTCRKSLARTLTNEQKRTNFTQSYMEYYSQDTLFAINFKANKPNKLFVNTVLLGKFDGAYQNYLLKNLTRGTIYSTTTYFKESIESIKSTIDLFTQQLREVTIKSIISYTEYLTLFHTVNKIGRKIERAKVEFALRESQNKYFLKSSINVI